jgi:hypothetical protein
MIVTTKRAEKNIPVYDPGKIANVLSAFLRAKAFPTAGNATGRKCDFAAALPSLYNTGQRWRGRMGE